MEALKGAIAESRETLMPDDYSKAPTKSLTAPKPMKQVDRPIMSYDKRRAEREMRRPLFGRRTSGRR